MGRAPLILLSVFLLSACSSNGSDQGSSASNSEPADEQSSSGSDAGEDNTTPDEPVEEPDTADNRIEFSGPPFSVSIDVMESFPLQYAASVQVRVNTGGWRLILDRAVHESDVVILYYTLEAPGPDELVTQALETLRDRHASGTDEIAGVQVHVHQRRRGDERVEEPDYLLAGYAPRD